MTAPAPVDDNEVLMVMGLTGLMAWFCGETETWPVFQQWIKSMPENHPDFLEWFERQTPATAIEIAFRYLEMVTGREPSP